MVAVYVERNVFLKFLLEREGHCMQLVQHSSRLVQCLHTQSVLAFCDVYRFRIYIAERHLSLIHIEQLREKRHTCIIQMATERQAPRQRTSILNNDRVL